jgi:hypothetical protein
MGWYGLDWTGSERELVEGSCEHGNKTAGYIKCWEVLQSLHNWRLLKKGSVPWVSEWLSDRSHFLTIKEYHENTLNVITVYHHTRKVRSVWTYSAYNAICVAKLVQMTKVKTHKISVSINKKKMNKIQVQTKARKYKPLDIMLEPKIS